MQALKYSFQVGGDSTVECEEFAVDEAGDGEGVEGLHEEFVGFLVVLVEALRPEVEEGGHLAAFVVSA